MGVYATQRCTDSARQIAQNSYLQITQIPETAVAPTVFVGIIGSLTEPLARLKVTLRFEIRQGTRQNQIKGVGESW